MKYFKLFIISIIGIFLIACEDDNNGTQTVFDPYFSNVNPLESNEKYVEIDHLISETINLENHPEGFVGLTISIGLWHTGDVGVLLKWVGPMTLAGKSEAREFTQSIWRLKDNKLIIQNFGELEVIEGIVVLNIFNGSKQKFFERNSKFLPRNSLKLKMTTENYHINEFDIN